MSPNPPGSASGRRSRRKIPRPDGRLIIIDQSQNPEEHLVNRTVTAEQRQAIRSHVMQVVRDLEEKAGVKRAVSKDKTKKPSPPTNTQVSSDKEPFDIIIQELRDFKLPAAPSLLRDNPFDDALSSESNTIRVVAELLQYCIEEFLFMVFPIHSSGYTENNTRCRKILHSKSARPATFFSLLSVIAAHKTIAADPDIDLNPLPYNSNNQALNTSFTAMNLMKHHALSGITQLVKQTIDSNQNLDEQIVEAVFLLIGAALSVGDFDEATLHLTYMEASMRLAPDFDHTSISHSPWIPIFDIAYASTLQCRPLFDLPWPQATVHELLGERIPPLPPKNKLALMASGFWAVTAASPKELQTIIRQAQLISLLCEFNAVNAVNAVNADCLSPPEHEQLYQKILQLQHDIVSFLYPQQNATTQMPAIEKVACLAILALVSISMIRVDPSSGQGRAVTKHHHSAVQHWLETTSNPPRQAEVKLLFWALLLFRQCSVDDIMSGKFESLIQHVTGLLRIETWKQGENILHEFLYMPTMQQDDLYDVWKEVLEE